MNRTRQMAARARPPRALGAPHRAGRCRAAQRRQRPQPNAALLRRRLVDEVCHAPHLIDAEIGSVLRRQVLAGDLPASDAETLLDGAATLVELRYATSDALRGAARALRETVSFYDTLYAALAGALGLPLLTADARLARAPRVPCAVELVSA